MTLSTIWSWEPEPRDPRIEFTVKPHELIPEKVHLWVDPLDPPNAGAIASLDLCLDDAEQLGNHLLVAVRAQRERIKRGETAP